MQGCGKSATIILLAQRLINKHNGIIINLKDRDHVVVQPAIDERLPRGARRTESPIFACMLRRLSGEDAEFPLAVQLVDLAQFAFSCALP